MPPARKALVNSQHSLMRRVQFRVAVVPSRCRHGDIFKESARDDCESMSGGGDVEYVEVESSQGYKEATASVPRKVGKIS